MDNDLLFGGEQHRFSPDRQWPGSPPACSQQDDGYRITWGPSMNSILVNCNVNALQSTSKTKSSSLLANIKRSSASAGFPSPTRPAASTSKVHMRSNPTACQNSVSDISADTSASSVSSCSTSASRLSKRRRRLLPSSSTSTLDFDVSARNNTSHGPRSLSADETTSDVTEMLGELARRLQANRNAATEQENNARLPLSNKENLHPGRADAAESNNAKGKQREKVATSPAVSTVMEESMSQGMAGMLLDPRNLSSRHRASKPASEPSGHHDPSRKNSSEIQRTPCSVMLGRSTLEDSGYNSRGPSGVKVRDGNYRQRIPETPEESARSQRAPEQKAVPATATFGKSAEETEQDGVASPARRKDASATFKNKLEVEDDLWGENDKSLEMAMSQMDIPDPPSSQQGTRSQSAMTLSLLPPPARLQQPSHEPEALGWQGFKSRDKRSRGISSGSSAASSSKLSSKPLIASQSKLCQPTKMASGHAIDGSSAPPADRAEHRTLSKSASTSSDKVKLGSARPVMAPARSCGSNIMAAPGLAKKFKCPTVTNTAAAKAEQEKKAAAAAKLVKAAGQPLPADEAWMEDMDWNVDDSF